MLDMIKQAYDSVCETVTETAKSAWSFLKALFTGKTVTVSGVIAVAAKFIVTFDRVYKQNLWSMIENYAFMIFGLFLFAGLTVIDWPLFLLASFMIVACGIAAKALTYAITITFSEVFESFTGRKPFAWMV